MKKRNVFMPGLATSIIVFSLSAPLFLDILVLDIFSNNVHWLIGAVIKLVNIALLVYYVPHAIKLIKGR